MAYELWPNSCGLYSYGLRAGGLDGRTHFRQGACNAAPHPHTRIRRRGWAPVMSVPRSTPFGGMQPSFHHILSPRAASPSSYAEPRPPLRHYTIFIISVLRSSEQTTIRSAAHTEHHARVHACAEMRVRAKCIHHACIRACILHPDCMHHATGQQHVSNPRKLVGCVQSAGARPNRSIAYVDERGDDGPSLGGHGPVRS